MGGIMLPWLEADVSSWHPSKECSGRPSGFGFLVLASPKALGPGRKITEQGALRATAFLLMEENRKSFRNPFYTPNVLSIFVLRQLTQYLPNLTEIHVQTFGKSEEAGGFLEKPGKLRIGFFNPKFHTWIAHRFSFERKSDGYSTY
jgi:hypothetical protein